MSARAERAMSSATVPAIAPPTSAPVSAATMPSTRTARALVDPVTSGSRGCRVAAASVVVRLRTSLMPQANHAPPPARDQPRRLAGTPGDCTTAAPERIRRRRRRRDYGRLAVGTEVVVVERHGLAARRTEPVVGLGV